MDDQKKAFPYNIMGGVFFIAGAGISFFLQSAEGSLNTILTVAVYLFIFAGAVSIGYGLGQKKK